MSNSSKLIEALEKCPNLLISTTNTIEGYEIVKTLNLVFANVVVGAGFMSDFMASITDFTGGRSGTYQRKMDDLYIGAEMDLLLKANAIGANAIIGFRISAGEISGKGVSMFMLTAYGTAVIVKPAIRGRYELYEHLLQLKSFLDAGIINQEEYDFECAKIKESSNNTVSDELRVQKEKEQRERELQEYYRQIEEEERIRNAAADEERRKLNAERDAQRNFKEEAISRMSSGIKEVINAGQATIRSIGKVTLSDEPVDLSNIVDAITINKSEDLFDAICGFLIEYQFVRACAYYLKATGTTDFEAAQEYVMGVKRIYESMGEDKLIEKIATRAVESVSPEGTNNSRRVLEIYLSANESVFDYLVTPLNSSGI